MTALQTDALHTDALRVLRDWVPPGDEQALLRQRYVALLEARPDAMTRACLPDHLTASVFVFDRDRSRVLLTHHAKAHRWFQLGGHPEPGDATLAGAALREGLEESGYAADDLVLDPRPVALDAHPVPFCAPGHGTHHLDVVYAAVAREGATHRVSDESLDVAWWPLDDLPDADLAPRVELALAGGHGAEESSGASS